MEICVDVLLFPVCYFRFAAISLKDLEPAGSGGVPVSQKSFDSGGSVPGTPDEFGSTSQVRIKSKKILKN